MGGALRISNDMAYVTQEWLAKNISRSFRQQHVAFLLASLNPIDDYVMYWSKQTFNKR